MTTPVVVGGICRSFRRALSPVVGLHSATSVDPDVVVSIAGSLYAGFMDLPVALLLASGTELFEESRL
jgi:hypothetical protein